MIRDTEDSPGQPSHATYCTRILVTRYPKYRRGDVRVPIRVTDRQALHPIKESRQPHPTASLEALEDSGSN